MRGGPLISVSSTVAGWRSVRISDSRRYLGDERYGSEGLATIRWMGECGNPPDRRVPRPFGLAHTRAADEASGDVRQSRRASNSGAATQTVAPPFSKAWMARHHVGPPPPSGKRPGHRSRIGSSRSSSSIPARPSTPYFRLMSESGRGQACTNRQPLPQRRRLPPQSARVALASSAGQMRDDRRLWLPGQNPTGGSDQAFCS